MTLAPGWKGAVWLFGLGGLAVICGVWMLVEQSRFERAGVSAVARVVDHETRIARNKANRPYEQVFDVYEVDTREGEPTRFVELVTGFDDPAPIGQATEAFYPPSKPENARLAGAHSGMARGVIGYGAVFLLIGRLYLRRKQVIRCVGSRSLGGAYSLLSWSIK
jgi:hypothetical protein